MGYVRLCDKAAVTPDEIHVFSVADLRVALVRRNERFYAFENRCGHMGVRLDDGDLVEETIRCSVHGIAFHLGDGSVANRPWEDCDAIRVFEVVEKEDEIGIALD